MSDPNLILKDTGSVEQTNRLVCMYAETIFHHEQTLRLTHLYHLTPDAPASRFTYTLLLYANVN